MARGLRSRSRAGGNRSAQQQCKHHAAGGRLVVARGVLETGHGYEFRARPRSEQLCVCVPPRPLPRQQPHPPRPRPCSSWNGQNLRGRPHTPALSGRSDAAARPCRCSSRSSHAAAPAHGTGAEPSSPLRATSHCAATAPRRLGSATAPAPCLAIPATTEQAAPHCEVKRSTPLVPASSRG